MQIPLKWINELVNIENIQLDELIEKLTLGGFEVEEILELEINGEKQTVLDISTTANRSDSLSIQGISMEIASLLPLPNPRQNSVFQQQLSCSILGNTMALEMISPCIIE